MRDRFPRLYAAASLKHGADHSARDPHLAFSAALCRGLIEATSAPPDAPPERDVFRGFMPRPH